MDQNTNVDNSPRVKAARRLAESLETHEDFIMYLMDHPNSEQAADRLARDLEQLDEPD